MEERNSLYHLWKTEKVALTRPFNVNKEFWKNLTDVEYCKGILNLHIVEPIKLTPGICSMHMFNLSDIYVIDRK